MALAPNALDLTPYRFCECAACHAVFGVNRSCPEDAGVTCPCCKRAQAQSPFDGEVVRNERGCVVDGFGSIGTYTVRRRDGSPFGGVFAEPG